MAGRQRRFLTAAVISILIISYCIVVECTPQVSPIGLSGEARPLADAASPADAPHSVEVVVPAADAKNASVSTTTTAAPTAYELQTGAQWEVDSRLPRDVLPEHYDVTLRPDITGGGFDGDVSIVLVLSRPRQHIYLHTKQLNISFVELLRLAPDAGNKTVGAQNVSISRQLFHTKHEFFVLNLNEPTPAGRYALNMKFNGTLLNKIKGFYRSSYKNKNNETRLLATSQLQSTDARQMFPCFDEPSIKSTFRVAVEHDANMTALSNMPVAERRPVANDGRVLSYFEQTPPMVTYLVAVIVCDFKSIEIKSARGVPIRIFATPEQVDNGNLNFALEVSKYSLDLYEKYFEIPYPLPKLDIVAIPDFHSGAMENWGLMTFREVYLIYDPYEAPSSAKQQVALVIAHELAHQWFGDLITTEWWDSLWLNEGFATRMEYIGVTGLDPEWPVSDYFVAIEMHAALADDALVTSHPIVVPGITEPAAIEEIFDNIPYAKGASCIRMLEHFMGEETFRRGVTRFLRQHIYSTANSDDLWRALQEQLAEHCANATTTAISQATNAYGAGTQCVDIKQVMSTFVLQMNYPVVHLDSLNATHGRVRQERFLIDKRQANATSLYTSPFGYKWVIPIAYRILDDANGKQGLFWLNDTEGTIEWSARSPSSLVKLNPGQFGFYRVSYPLDLWSTIADRLTANINFLPDASDRSGLISDAFALARANIVPYTVPLSLLRYLKQERALSVWITVTESLEYVGTRLEAVPDAYWMFRALVRDVVRPAFAELGWQDIGSFTQRRLRGLLANLACEYGDTDCLNTVRQLFRDWVYNGKRVPPNFRLAVYSHGMRQAGGEREWQFVFDHIKTTLSPQEKRLLYASLANSVQPWQLQRYMNVGRNETVLRRQDYLSIFSYMAANPVALPYAWDHVRTNWPRLVERFTLNDRYLGSVIPAFASYFNGALRLAEMQEFFEKYPEAGAGKMQRLQALERLQTNIQWLAQHNQTVTKWLTEQTF